MSELAKITPEDLSLVENNAMNAQQLQLILKATPARFIKKRPGKGGGQWSYVSGSYVRKVLNLMFGWDWDFIILDDKIIHGEAVVKGQLTIRAGGRTITKTQYGNKDIICKRGTQDPLSIGNDLKAAATDALKKCAQELGIASDVYSPDEFTPVKVEEITLEELVQLCEEVKHKLTGTDLENIQRIIQNKEQINYTKAWKLLKSL